MIIPIWEKDTCILGSGISQNAAGNWIDEWAESARNLREGETDFKLENEEVSR